MITDDFNVTVADVVIILDSQVAVGVLSCGVTNSRTVYSFVYILNI